MCVCACVLKLFIDVIVPLLDGNNLTNFADNLPSPQQLGQDVSN